MFFMCQIDRSQKVWQRGLMAKLLLERMKNNITCVEGNNNIQ